MFKTNKALSIFSVAAVFLLIAGIPVFPATITVGPGKRYKRIEVANALAKPGDIILVYPQKGNKPYEYVAVNVTKPHLTFKAVLGRKEGYIPLSGEAVFYSGKGKMPRAVFQFNRNADGCILDGFELFGAHNKTYNAAGVRINQASEITIRNCAIHHNDMGIMSNGDGSKETGFHQVIEYCIIHHNGNFKAPGYNHNLYLGGTSVIIRFCHIYSSLTGHNIKSRAHYNRIEYSYVHDSANREFDLVDATDTLASQSHSVLIGNIIVKAKNCKGNRAVIHFGQDSNGKHNGFLYLVHNTIITPYVSPVIDISAPKVKAYLIGNIVYDGGTGRKNQILAMARGGAKLKDVTGTNNWFSQGFGMRVGTGLHYTKNTFAKGLIKPFFVNSKKGNYRLAKPEKGIVDAGLFINKILVPDPPAKTERYLDRGTDGTFEMVRIVKKKEEYPMLFWQYRHPAFKEKRPHTDRLDLGAYEFEK